MARTAGKISKQTFYLEWSITDFFSRLGNSKEYCESPTFQFSGIDWTLKMYPKGYISNGYISLFLRRCSTQNGDKCVQFKLAIKKIDGSMYSRVTEHFFSENESDWGWYKFAQLAEISTKRELLVPGNVLTISCTISSENIPTEAERSVSESEHLPNEQPSSIPKILWGALSRDLKDLFLSQKNSDFIIKVKDEVFPVHRMVLSSRSTVFSGMLEHDMKENRSGSVEIFDTNPSTFRDFLLFMYSGEVRNLSSVNVYELYVLSDKYDLKDLKNECRSFMNCTLSVDTICHVLHLADRYNEVDLKEAAEKYFDKNVALVMASDQWETFESGNRVLVIQLLKSIVLKKMRK